MFRHTSRNLSRGNNNLALCFRGGSRKNCTSTNSEISNSEEYSFVKAPCMQHWRKKWEQDRTNRLTSSTFAQAIGFWPNRRAQLWLEKIGAVEPFSGNAATCWNKIKELEALDRYHTITKNEIYFPEFVTFREEEWLGGSPDGDIHGIRGSKGVLEVKCPFFDGDKSLAYPWKKVPWYYVPQAQGLMEIMDRDWLELYCWTVNGSSLFIIERDSVYWVEMKEALVDFWERHVVPAREEMMLCSGRKGSVVVKDPLVELSDFVPDSRHERCNQILRGTERIVQNSECLFYEIDGQFLH